MYALRDVSRSWALGAVQVPALRRVDVAFEPGVATAVMGPSGSGKSTLLQVAALLDPPSTGGVWHAETCLSAMSDNARSDFRCQRLGFVHQSYPMVASLTVAENIILPAVFAGHRRKPAVALAAELLDQVGLAGFTDRDVRTLSGGERQRVAIARALINRPLVVFADEPTAALDQDTGARVLDMLVATVSRSGAALVMATHDPQVAARADRVLRLDGGRVVEPTP